MSFLSLIPIKQILIKQSNKIEKSITQILQKKSQLHDFVS